MRTKSYDTLEKEAIAESLGISLNKYKYIERRIAESDNPNDTVENWVKEGKIRQRKTKEEIKEEKEEKAKEKEKENDTKDTKEDKKEKETDIDSDTNTKSDNETEDSITNDSVEVKEEKAFKSTITINTNKHVCDRCHSKIKDSEYNLNLSYLINGLAGYRFRIDSNRVKLCHDCAIELGKVVEEWLINNGNGVKVKPWMGDNKENKENREEDKELDGFDDFNF